MAAYETREQWGSQQSDPAGQRVGRQSELIVHHTWKPHVPATATHSDERATVRSIQRYHVQEKGWDDVGYAFLIFQSGRGYEGRGWFRSGAHTTGRNEKPSIVFVINGDDHLPTDEAWETGRQIIAEGIQVGALTSDYTLSGHADYSAKSCPGDKTYPVIGEHLSPTLIQQEDGMAVADWAKQAWEWAKSKRIVSDQSDPNEVVTKQELAVFLHRYHQKADKAGTGGGLQRGDTVKLQ